MPTSTDGTEFDDNDELDRRLFDEKASDTLVVSDTEEALRLIDDFQERDDDSPWRSLDRTEVAQRLIELIVEPELVHQGQLNLCGPAAFYSQWGKRDPVAFANFAIELFESGQGKIGTLAITPSANLLEKSYSEMQIKMGGNITPQADWYLLGALRNSEDLFWQGTFTGDPDEELSALTRPDELASWFTATGLYESVDCRANWMILAGILHAQRLLFIDGSDVTMLLHSNMIAAAQGEPLDKNWLRQQFPNHFVVMRTPVVLDTLNQQVSFTLWSWGKITQITVSQQVFIDNYYGMVIAKMRRPAADA